MRYPLFLILFIFIGFCTKGQQISGTISHLQDRQLIFISNDSFLLYHADTVLADEDGHFNIRLKLKHAGYVYMRNTFFEAGDIFVSPGTTLIIGANGSDMASFNTSRKYKGTIAAPNNYNADVLRQPLINIKTYQQPEDEFVLQVKHFFAGRDSMRRMWLKKLSATQRQNRINHNFYLIDSINNSYNLAMVYFSYCNSFLKEEKKATFFTKNIQPYLIQNTGELYLKSPNYRWFWNKLVQYKYDQSITGTAISPKPQWYNYYVKLPGIVEKNLQDRMKQVTCASLEESLIRNYEVCADSIFPILDRTSTYLLRQINATTIASAYQKQIKEIKNSRQTFKKGEQLPDFLLTDTLGKSYSLASFKGKVIYFDVWASWCIPCIVQFPAAHQLIEKFKDKEQIVFISVSVDNSKKDWIKGLHLHHPGGLQLWANNGFKSAFVQNYKIHSIPQYMVIDQAGKIVNFNAPRPDDVLAINKLLNETLP